MKHCRQSLTFNWIIQLHLETSLKSLFLFHACLWFCAQQLMNFTFLPIPKCTIYKPSHLSFLHKAVKPLEDNSWAVLDSSFTKDKMGFCLFFLSVVAEKTHPLQDNVFSRRSLVDDARPTQHDKGLLSEGSSTVKKKKKKATWPHEMQSC